MLWQWFAGDSFPTSLTCCDEVRLTAPEGFVWTSHSLQSVRLPVLLPWRPCRRFLFSWLLTTFEASRPTLPDGQFRSGHGKMFDQHAYLGFSP